MSDQVTITVHRRNADGTWPPGEEPPRGRQLIVRACTGGANRWLDGQVLHDGSVLTPVALVGKVNILAWADVTDVFAGGREAKP